VSESAMPVLSRALVPEVLPAVMPDVPAVPEVLPAPLPALVLPAPLPADLPFARRWRGRCPAGGRSAGTWCGRRGRPAGMRASARGCGGSWMPSVIPAAGGAASTR